MPTKQLFVNKYNFTIDDVCGTVDAPDAELSDDENIYDEEVNSDGAEDSDGDEDDVEQSGGSGDEDEEDEEEEDNEDGSGDDGAADEDYLEDFDDDEDNDDEDEDEDEGEDEDEDQDDDADEDNEIGSASIPGRMMRIAIKKDKYWKNGQTLVIRFMVGRSSHPLTRRWVQEVSRWSREWLAYANLRFKFTVNPRERSDIRISFNPHQSNHSKVGTEAKGASQKESTMNLAFNSRTTVYQRRRHVLHEFGHALGAVHEHQSPAAGMPWDKETVIRERKNKGHSKESTMHNILKAYSKKEISQYSQFDPHSIMLYNIPASWTRGRFVQRLNMTLSQTDKHFMGKVYPKH